MQITHAELIGLTPQQALIDTARWYLQLDDMQDNQVLENQLHNGHESAENILPVTFLEATAAPQPAPGGGSAAALAGALAAALAEMVAGLTIGRKKYAEVAGSAAAIGEEAGALRRALTAAIADDAAAFEAVMAAYRLQEGSPERKAAAVETATYQAAEVPLRVAALAVQAAQLAEEMARVGNVNAATDAAAAALLARAAVEAAVLNVRVNAPSLKDESTADKFRAVQTTDLKRKSGRWSRRQRPWPRNAEATSYVVAELPHRHSGAYHVGPGNRLPVRSGQRGRRGASRGSVTQAARQYPARRWPAPSCPSRTATAPSPWKCRRLLCRPRRNGRAPAGTGSASQGGGDGSACSNGNAIPNAPAAHLHSTRPARHVAQ